MSTDTPNQPLELVTTTSGTPVQLRSEDVIVQAPFSYVGSTKRILRAMGPWMRRTVERFRSRKGTAGDTFLRTLAVVGSHSATYLALAAAWTGVTCWYATFGVLLVPYRLIRRADRKAERNRLQHQELMAAMTVAARNADKPVR